MNLPNDHRGRYRLAVPEPHAGDFTAINQDPRDFTLSTQLRAMGLEATNQCRDERAAAADWNTPGKGVNESPHVENERARSLFIRPHQELGGALQQMDLDLVVMEMLVDNVEHALLHDMHQLPPRGVL